LSFAGFVALCAHPLMKLVSWNVNGVRAALKKGLLDYLAACDADVVCLQETKAHPGDVQHVAWPAGYEAIWNSADKKGYSGTVIFTRVKPKSVHHGIGVADHDTEGRVIAAELADFWLVNVYQPNSQRGLTRLDYRTQGVGSRRFWPSSRNWRKRASRSSSAATSTWRTPRSTSPTRRATAATPASPTRSAPTSRTCCRAASWTRCASSKKGPGTTRGGARWPTAARATSGGASTISSRARRCAGAQRAWISPEVMGSDHCPVGLELKV
jgi:exodeoxyribonuclease-3